MIGPRRIRGRPRKNRRKAIRHDITYHHLTGEDMTVDRKARKSRIRLEG